MVNIKHNQLSKINKEIVEDVDALSKNDSSDSTASAIYVFISIDLTNSTVFKVRHEKLWQKVIPAFYKAVQRAFGVGKYREEGQEIEDIVSLWKFVGDEVLLYAPIYNSKSIDQIIVKANLVVRTIDQKIIENIQETLTPAEQSGIEQELGAKGVVWIGLCNTNTTCHGRNIVYEPECEDGFVENKSLDFLGTDIDEGFRIARFTTKKRVVVSPLLAGVVEALHNENSGSITEHYIITSYQGLKGIWNNRKVPIVMYLPGDDVQNTFEYDELECDTFCSGMRYNFKEYRRSTDNNLKKICTILQSVDLDNIKKEIVAKLQDEEYTSTGGVRRQRKREM